MKIKQFYIFLFLITGLGLVLRLIDYDRIPQPTETFDEVHYAWGGITWIKQGIPKSWSWFDSYQKFTFINKYGINWRIVEPLLEKPPLYFLLSGLSVLPFADSADIYNLPHSAIRILPLILSCLTIMAIAILGRQIFSPSIGLLASFLYATTPQIVLANRLSLTENLLTPLSLLSLIIFFRQFKKSASVAVQPVLLATIAALSFLTKQIGLSVGLSLAAAYFINKKWRQLLIVCIGMILGILLYVSFGAYYDWQLFLQLQSDVRHAHALKGLPETIFSLFRYPTATAQNKLFLDGTILAGLLLLITSFLWMFDEKPVRNLSHLSRNKQVLLLIFPFIYLTLMVLGESGSDRDTFFGWYVYPLYPFMILVLTKFFSDLWQQLDFFRLLFVLLVLGSSTVRFLFLLLPFQYHHLWQYSFVGTIIFSSLVWIFGYKLVQQKYLVLLFLVYLGLNIMAVVNIGRL